MQLVVLLKINRIFIFITYVEVVLRTLNTTKLSLWISLNNLKCMRSYLISRFSWKVN